MNSVVPIANPPEARASRAARWLVVRGSALAGVLVSVQPSDASASLNVCDGRITDDAFASSGR